MSCFEYILAGIVLNAGPPFRQKVVRNGELARSLHERLGVSCSADIEFTGPFIATVSITLLATLYMIVAPAKWVQRWMQLTKTSSDFKLFMIVLGVLYFVIAWSAEKFIFPRLARWVGEVQEAVLRRPKQRKIHKLIQEQMRL